MTTTTTNETTSDSRRLASFNRYQADHHAGGFHILSDAADDSTSVERRAAYRRQAEVQYRRMVAHLVELDDAELFDAQGVDRNSTDADRTRATAAGRIIVTRLDAGLWTLGA